MRGGHKVRGYRVRAGAGVREGLGLWAPQFSSPTLPDVIAFPVFSHLEPRGHVCV